MRYRLTDFLDETAEKYRDKIAVIDPNNSISYGELRDTAKRIAAYLNSIGINNRSVGIFVPKSIEAVCILWGVLYSGNHYTFLDEENSEQRLGQIVDKLGSALIVTNQSNYDACISMFGGYPIKTYEEILDESVNLVEDFSVDSYSQTPAYVNFTSGTTGIPKGVVVSHRAVIDFISVFVRTFDITDKDVIGNQAPFDFDVSVKDIYSCAISGATLVLIPREYFVKPKEIADYLDETKVTTLIWAVSAMCFMTTLKVFRYKKPSAINKIMFSGEVMPYNHLKKWMEQYPDAMYVNLYGPTEITCNCTYHILDNKRDYSEGIPIGRPFVNEKVILLDEDDKEVRAPGKQGEICVSGVTLASGYLNDPGATSAVFVQNPCNDRYLELIYKTGDFGYYDENGELYYAGRRDNQIKLFGHRIEIGEIEHIIGGISGIDRVCVLFLENKLHLFYCGMIDESEIREKISGLMSDYMRPNTIRKIDEMPVNKNGKIDRNKLKELVKNE